MAGAIELDLSGPEKRLKRLANALKAEEEGKTLRRELTKGIRSAAGPARQAARASIRSMKSKGHSGSSLRSAIASGLSISVKSSGKDVGVRIQAKQTKLRGFSRAPEYTDGPGWRHPVFGHRTRWVSQHGKNKWFEDSIKKEKPGIRKEIQKVMDETAEIIARRV